MTVVDERPAETETRIPRCTVLISVADLVEPDWPIVPHGLAGCGLPAVSYWLGACACGHVRDMWLCEVHEALAGKYGCRACLELEARPHDCPLSASRVSPGGTS